MLDEAENDSCFLSPEDSEEFQVDVDKFRKEIVVGHNHYRTLHGSPPLSLMNELNESAQNWADTLAQKGYVQYAEYLLSTGESITTVDLSSESLNGKLLSMKWYKEIKNYSFSEPRWRSGAFHFTQMMWHSTTHIGAGLSRAPGSPKVFVVVRYLPAGNSNMPGEFHRNVLPRISVPTESRPSWCLDDDVILRSSTSGRHGSTSGRHSRRSYTSASVIEEAFV